MSGAFFRYHQEIETRFPAARAEVIVACHMVNNVAAESLAHDYRTARAEAAGLLMELGPADRPSIKAWRSAFTAFGVKPTQHRNAAEALLRRLARRWCWKQSAGGATGPETTDVMYVIEAVHQNAADAVRDAADELVDLLARHQPVAEVDRFTAPC